MSKLKKIAVAVIGAIAAVIIIFAILNKMGINLVSNTINTVLSPVQTAVSSICRPIENFAVYLSEIKNIHEENTRLKSENETLKKEIRSSEEYKKENTRLKKLLNLTDELVNCTTVPAKVVGCEPGNWFSTLMINKGTNDGIKVSDVVITESGLVGRISETGVNWAKIVTVLDPGNAVGIKLTRTGEAGIAEGDSELIKKGRFKIDYIAKDASVIKGDLLETSGLGGIYPPGLSVGTVEEIEIDNTGELVNTTVIPAVKPDRIYEVIVVTYWENARYDKNGVMIEYATGLNDKDTGLDNSSLKNDSVSEETEENADENITEISPDNTEENEE